MKKYIYGALVLATAIAVSFGIHIMGAKAQTTGFASFEACVYDKHSGRPIEGALVYKQSLGASGGGQWTGPDGCIGDNMVNVELWFGDYIEAEYEHDGKLYTQQFQIPNRLSPKVYRKDFHLEIPRRGGPAGR